MTNSGYAGDRCGFSREVTPRNGTRPLKREAALKHPLSKEVYSLMNQVLRCDEAVSAYLA